MDALITSLVRLYLYSLQLEICQVWHYIYNTNDTQQTHFQLATKYV
jgi:hypothetical protein